MPASWACCTARASCSTSRADPRRLWDAWPRNCLRLPPSTSPTTDTAIPRARPHHTPTIPGCANRATADARFGNAAGRRFGHGTGENHLQGDHQSCAAGTGLVDHTHAASADLARHLVARHLGKRSASFQVAEDCPGKLDRFITWPPRFFTPSPARSAGTLELLLTGAEERILEDRICSSRS